MDKKVSVFLPCRAGSERVPNKNTKEFAGISGGLLKIKLSQLAGANLINEIILSTNDDEVYRIAKEIKSEKILMDKRPENLATSATSTDDLIKYVPKIIKDSHILWTHVTSPFIDSCIYDKAIEKYFSLIKATEYDSLMSVTKIQTFLWKNGKALNYDRSFEKWPRTQTLEAIYEVNSGFFISSRDNYVKYEDRIGRTPFLYELDSSISFDIDWPDDFELAQIIFERKNS